MIYQEEIIKYLKNSNVAVRVYDCIDSTNTEAKKYACSCHERRPVLFVAREQSSGRGRLGRSFLSRADMGIFMTLLYFTDEKLEDAVNVTTATAAFVAESIEEVTGKRMLIKWVNDIYNEDGKVSGILAESVITEKGTAIIVGIGINTGDIDFPNELKGIASTIGELDGRENILIAKITDRLMDFAGNSRDRSYMKAYRERFMLDGKPVDLYVGGELRSSGMVLGVDDDGGLIYLPQGLDKSCVIHSGEVSVRIHK